jgi:hypothetical protein
MKKSSFLLIIITFFYSINVIAQKVFKDERYGFSMDEPKDWYVGDKKVLTQNLDKYELNEADLAKLIKDNKGSLLLSTFYKYDPKEFAGIIPTIQINVRQNPTQNFEQFNASISKSAESFKAIFPDFTLTVQPQVKEVNGIKSNYFVGNYTLVAKQGGAKKINVRCLAIPSASYFFQLTFIDELGDKANAELFDQLVNSIKITRNK